MAATRHRFFELSDEDLADFLPNLQRMVALTDGMYLTHGLTEMLALRFLGELGADVLVRGHGGELLKAKLAWPWHTDDRIHAMRSLDEFVLDFARVNYISAGVSVDDLFTPAWAEQYEGSRTARSSRPLPLVHRCRRRTHALYLYAAELHRRFTVASLELFRTVAEVRVPFLDPAFLAVLFKAPSAWRDDTSHVALTGRHQPAMLRVRNSNTGAPGDAGPLAEAIYERLNAVLRRLNVRDRHYHRFDAWMRDWLRIGRAVDPLPGEPRSGSFQEQTLRRLLAMTRAGMPITHICSRSC